ncbi:hypothetical protein D3C77_527410 [compost metagenome]
MKVNIRHERRQRRTLCNALHADREELLNFPPSERVEVPKVSLERMLKQLDGIYALDVLREQLDHPGLVDLGEEVRDI